MKKKIVFILIIISLLMMQAPTYQADDIRSMVVYGKATYDGTGVDDISVTINLSYNSTIYDEVTRTTYGGGKYQFDLDNMDISWNSSMTVTVSATYSSETDTNTFRLTNSRTNDGLHESNLVIQSSEDDDDDGSSGGDDDDDGGTATSGTNNTTYLVTIGGILIFALIFGLAFFLFGNNPSAPMPPKKGTNKTASKKSYVKSGVEMEEYTPPNKRKIKW